MIHVLCLRDQAAHQLLILELTLLGRPDSLVMGVDGFLQFEPQVLPVLLKGLDLSQSSLLHPLQPLDLFSLLNNL